MKPVMFALALVMIRCASPRVMTNDEMVREYKKCTDGGMKAVTLVDGLSDAPVEIRCAAADFK